MSVLEVVEKFPCGYNKKDSAVATLYNNGELIVRGEGDMMNYTFELPPWFKLRKKIKSVIIMKGIRKIGNSAFSQLPKLTTVHLFDAVEEIGKFAFVGCPELKKVVLPKNADHEDAFDAHVVVENATVKKHYNNLGARKNDRVWATLYSNGHLIIEGSGHMDNFKSKNKRPWHGNEEDVIFVTIKNGVTAVGSYAFKGFYMLKSVEIENAKKIGRHSFEYCKSLIDLKTNNTIEEIGMNAFTCCESLIEFSVPDAVCEIAPRIFAGCKSLKIVHIPETVTKIYKSAFSCCTSLESGIENFEKKIVVA